MRLHTRTLWKGSESKRNSNGLHDFSHLRRILGGHQLSMLPLGKNRFCCSIERIKPAKLARRLPNELACDWLLGLYGHVANQPSGGYRLGPR